MLAQRPLTTRHSRSHARRGTFAPAAIIALVVVVSGVALVLDKLWLDAAQLELNTAVEAAALSSGRALASDDLLRDQPNTGPRLEQARLAAAELAAKNRIAGEPVQLDPSPEGSIRFGKLVYREDLRETVFIESTEHPTTVVVGAERSHTQSNPVALFWQGISGFGYGNVFARAEASVDNHVIALRALDGIPIPVLPLAILKQPQWTYNGEQLVDDWQTQIEQRQGSDLLSVDATSHNVVTAGDGIPEMTLVTIGTDKRLDHVNAHFFLVDPQTSYDEFYQHIKRGWGQSDFKSATVPEVRLDRGPLSVSPMNVTGGDFASYLQPHLGECRIVFLYEQLAGDTLKCSGIAAGRIMSVTQAGQGGLKLVFQPGVLTTRTAVLVNDGLTTVAFPATANKYVYKLHLTY